MRDFTRMENQKMRNDDEFSASACQKIHSELLASVNEIYKNLKKIIRTDSTLRRTADRILRIRILTMVPAEMTAIIRENAAESTLRKMSIITFYNAKYLKTKQSCSKKRGKGI